MKIAGMIDESMDLDQMKKDPQPWELDQTSMAEINYNVGRSYCKYYFRVSIYMMILFIWGKDIMPYTDMPEDLMLRPLQNQLVLEMET